MYIYSLHHHAGQLTLCSSGAHQKCPLTKSVLSPKVSTHQKCPLTKSVLSPKVSSHQKCPLTKSFPSPKVSSHQKFPLTKSVLMKRPPLRNVADHKTSLVTKHPSNKMCPKVYFNFRGKYLPLVVFFFFLLRCCCFKFNKKCNPFAL